MSEKISFTIDGWTSSNNVSFLGITAHLITNEWELKSLLLDFIKLDGPHSGDNIKVAFLKSLSSYNIESKVSFINSKRDNLKIENKVKKNFLYRSLV